MLTKQMVFRLPAEQHDAFQEYCADQGIPVSEALRRYINSCVSPAEAPIKPEASEVSADQLAPVLSHLADRLECLEQLRQRQDQHEELLEDHAELLAAQRTVEEDDQADEAESAEERQAEEQPETKEDPPWPFNLLFEKKADNSQ